MDAEHRRAGSHRISRLAEKMRGKKGYRDAYVSSQTRQFLARQMREFRGDASQTEFGKRIDKQQTVVSRLEDPNYGTWNLQTMFDVASKLDVAVLVKFVDFATFLRHTDDRSPEAILPKSYDQDEIDELARKTEAQETSGALEAFFDSTEQKLRRGDDKRVGFDREAANENSAQGLPLPPQSLTGMRA